MRKYTRLDKEKLELLYNQNKSYKEIAEILGYSRKSVNGYFYKVKGKMLDSRKFRRNNISLTDEQKEILFGTLMGDGNIQKQKIESYTGRYNHSIKQLSYLTHLQEKLSNLTSKVKYFQTKSKTKIYEGCYFSLKSGIQLRSFYNSFYSTGHKEVPKDLSLLTPRAMAYWFMDDGFASGRCTISIATCGFSYESLVHLKNFLYETYKIEVNINSEKKLYFKAASSRTFYNLVKDYIIPEMMYKFKYIKK